MNRLGVLCELHLYYIYIYSIKNVMHDDDDDEDDDDIDTSLQKLSSQVSRFFFDITILSFFLH